MENGRFTKDEREYLLSLDAVDEARAKSIAYGKRFKEERMRRYRSGEKPGAIFANAGMPSSLIGYKRIERAIYHWKGAEAKGALADTGTPQARHRSRIDAIKREKRGAAERQREIRRREVAAMEEKSAKQKARAKTREEKIIASQAARIAALEAQAKALKALGALARRAQRAPQTTEKPERFELISQLKADDPRFSVSAAREALEVSRRGYRDWVAAAPKRAAREEADLEAKAQVEAACGRRGFEKGSRQVADCPRRAQKVVMNREKARRITREFCLAPRRKRESPHKPIGTGGLPKVAPNAVNRDFRRGEPLKVVSADITYLPGRDGFSYLSGAIDCETDVALAHVTSDSMEEQSALDTYDQLEGLELPDDIWACSDQGVHYTARAHRDKLAEPGINQSMSRKACCWDNAPIESFWGRTKEQIPATDGMPHAEIAALVDDHVGYCNNERGQARLGWLAPVEYAAKLARREGGDLCSAA